MTLRIINWCSVGAAMGIDAGDRAGAGSWRPARVPRINPVVTGSWRDPSQFYREGQDSWASWVDGSGAILQRV